MKNRAISGGIFLFLCVCLLGQTPKNPFPQNVDYPYGYQTTSISTSNIQSMYNKWKTNFLTTCSGMYRVKYEKPDSTRSEGMGYGMILAAYFGEKSIFDGLFAFYKSKRTSTALNLMAWNVTCDGIGDPGSATDGDLDVAYALIVAYNQWGGDYLIEADSILDIIKDNYFTTCGGNIYTMYPGCGVYGLWGGCDRTDISYYSPGYFRVFYDATGESFWLGVADDAYTILDNGAHWSTGLVRDWQSYSGGAPSGGADYYWYDASRVPWRMALDYIWNGNSTADAWCDKISAFADDIGASDIVDGYELDGTPHEEARWNNSSFVGGFAVGGMCYSQAMVNSFASRLLWLDQQGWDDTYYNLSLRCLYVLVLSGNFWQPAFPSGIGGPESLPGSLKLAQNYPNPFDAVTTIEYSLAEEGFVKLSVYDLAGREIKTLVEESVSAGGHEVSVDMRNLSSGIYIYRLEAGGNSIQKKMILLR